MKFEWNLWALNEIYIFLDFLSTLWGVFRKNNCVYEVLFVFQSREFIGKVWKIIFQNIQNYFVRENVKNETWKAWIYLTFTTTSFPMKQI